MTILREFSLDFPYAYGMPKANALFRFECEDFVVNEQLGFSPSGEGEHIMIEVLKRDDNTPWVAKQIARLAGVKPMDVGYCGMKDRRAVTRQWFSVYLPKDKDIEWQQLNGETMQVLSFARHHRKLRRGEHLANQFLIRLRQVSGAQSDTDRRLASIDRQGVPNYFGEQRFGQQLSNLHLVDELFARNTRIKQKPQPHHLQQQKGMVLSAARSWLFNSVLAARLDAGNWQDPLPGEPEAYSSGPLWGRGRARVLEDALAFEARVLQPWQDWCDGLEHSGLNQERRALVQRAVGLQWRWEGTDLQLEFSLPPGQFATSILREIARLQQPVS